MSIPHGLLALLDQRPMYGYQLKSEFERATGSTWPLNIGQVYTTLTRLERDGQVVAHSADGEGRQRYEITALGKETLTTWFSRPVTLSDRPRDELAIKLALAALAPGLDIRRVVQAQRTATMRRLQELTVLKRDAAPETTATPDDPHADLAWRLVLDNLRFMAEAELRWLDHCEGALARVRTAPAARRTDPPADLPADLPTDLPEETLR